nr:BTB/POZ domain-containing protein 19-like [Lytechinus pictus]
MGSEILMKGDPVPFAKSMGRLINCKEFSDVKFIVGESRQHIFAHRCLLVSRCEVFKAMFAEKVVKETSTNVPLVLSDVEPDIFMVVLEFIYTNCASLCAKTVVDVLASSIEYGLDELRKLCNAYLIRNLSISTACETMQAAVTYGQDDLKLTTLGFIEEHTQEVFRTKQFQELSDQALAVILQSSRLLMDEIDILETIKEWASVNSVREKRSRLSSTTSTRSKDLEAMLDKYVSNMTESLAKLGDTLKREIREVAGKVKDMETKMSEMIEALKYQGREVDELKTKTIPKIQEEIKHHHEEVSKEVEKLQLYVARENIVLLGIPEEEGESEHRKTEEVVRKFLVEN